MGAGAGSVFLPFRPFGLSTFDFLTFGLLDFWTIYNTMTIQNSLKMFYMHICPDYKQFAAAMLFLSLSLYGSITLAQTPAPPQKGPVAITGGTIHTITNGVIEEGSMLFEDGIITAIGQNISIPEDAEIIDATGKQVYPGFIQGRSTIGLMEIARIQESTDLQETGAINPNIRAQVAFHPASAHLPVAALHGVTTVVPAPRGSLIAGMTAAMMTDGWTWEEMTLREGLGMIIEWPSVRDKDDYARETALLEDAFNKAKRYQRARQAAADNPDLHHPLDVRWEAMKPVLEGEMPIIITAGEMRQIQAAIAWAKKENLHMVLAGSRDLDLVASQLAEQNIPVMLTGVISSPARDWEGYDEGYRIPRKLYEAGVDFFITGDASAASTYRIHHHAASAVAFGLPEEKALRAITFDAARILGIDDLVGSLEKGKHATFMITDGHALEMSTRKEQVFIQGREIEMLDKHKRLYQHYLEKHRQANP